MFLSASTNIHFNLALEQFIMENAKTPQLYLWTNSKSVIIGINQDIFTECNLYNIEKDKVMLARRKSGGGAVYHDIGNLCFTIIRPLNLSTEEIKRENFNFILDTLSNLGIKCELTGRNDILYNGFKVSGSAFELSKNILCHHGTFLLNSDLEKIDMYLTPDVLKLKRHYVGSVKRRVSNLGINKEKLISKLFENFSKQSFYKDSENIVINSAEILSIYKKLSSTDWVFGKQREFNYAYKVMDENGIFDYKFNIESKSGIKALRDFEVYSDTLNSSYVEKEKEKFKQILSV